MSCAIIVGILLRHLLGIVISARRLEYLLGAHEPTIIQEFLDALMALIEFTTKINCCVMDLPCMEFLNNMAFCLETPSDGDSLIDVQCRRIVYTASCSVARLYMLLQILCLGQQFQ
jgi:hypothetical protein